ncbi:GNAT family N-acetyltransferase [Lentisphaera marina]|uniref:GNAT family N-acetyltransferase n=1 Tax=Lentisphaera marina TaxID=1111041 RepID=UPI002365B310|nr:GNAT family N-acetyltransferase [Lentisphaera marina]MDD7986603.1 GNAT family N-acetyltransferase [Lentisphaera marina]
MKKLHIRVAQESDYEIICQLFEQGDQHHENILPKYFSTIPKARPLSDIMRYIEKADAEFFLAFKNDIPVGILNIKKSCLPALDFFRAQEFALIDSIIIDQKFRQQGIGNVLLKKAKEWSKNQKLQQLQLVVWSANQDAINFYTKNGFKTLSQKMLLEL